MTNQNQPTGQSMSREELAAVWRELNEDQRAEVALAVGLARAEVRRNAQAR
jgi:hypothetical protein